MAARPRQLNRDPSEPAPDGPRPNLDTREGIRAFLAARVEELSHKELEGQTAAAFAALTRQLVILTRELELEAMQGEDRPVAAGAPDFAGMSEAELKAYLDTYHGEPA